jgi:hypothetical protein
MDVKEQLVTVNRLLHVRINPNLRYRSQHRHAGTEVDLSVRAALDVLVPLVANGIHDSTFPLPSDAPPIEPFGLCIRVIIHGDKYTVRLFSLRSRDAGLSGHYKWRGLDMVRLLTWGDTGLGNALDVWMDVLEHNHLRCGEKGLLDMIRDYAAPSRETITKLAWSFS